MGLDNAISLSSGLTIIAFCGGMLSNGLEDIKYKPELYMEPFADKLARFKEIISAKAVALKNQERASASDKQGSSFIFNIKRLASLNNHGAASFSEKLAEFKEAIAGKALIFGDQEKIFTPDGRSCRFIFDIRKVMLLPEALDLVSDLFWDIYRGEYPFQVGGQESAAIPIIAAIIMKGKERGMGVSGFYTRKERKNTGRQRLIEGVVDGRKIIFVDDLINSGSTIARQLKVLQDIGRTPSHIFTIINFRPLEEYAWVKNSEIKHASLFSLDDFGLKDEIAPAPLFVESYRTCWRFKSPDPNFFYVVPKSAPAIDDKKVYFGSDGGTFWALRQADGRVAWKFKVGEKALGKSIFSSPAIYNNSVYFGAYDGNLYSLDVETGKSNWVFREADWVGSSPAVAPELNTLFVGLGFALPQKRGGIVALNLKTGEKIWEHRIVEHMHSSPLFIEELGAVAIGGNDSAAYLFEAKTGKLLWTFQTGGEIKASFAFDAGRNLISFGSFDGRLYVLDASSGKQLSALVTGGPIYSTPLFYENSVVCASLDKRIYSVDLEAGKLNWSHRFGGRTFASPVIIEGNIFIGSNDGKMSELDPRTGRVISSFQASERIVNKIAWNQNTRRFFLPTYANELYCLEKIE